MLNKKDGKDSLFFLFRNFIQTSKFVDCLITLASCFMDRPKQTFKELLEKLLQYKASQIGDNKKLELNGLNLVSSSIKKLDFKDVFKFDIKSVDFSQNCLEKIYFENWDHWNNLTDIDFSKNQLKKINEGCFKLKSLKTLNLSHNKITQLSLPDEMSPSLSELNLGHNQIRELGEAFGKSLIEKLDLQHNRFEVVPLQLKKMKLLRYLNLIGNKGILEFPLFFAEMSPLIKELELEGMDQVIRTYIQHYISCNNFFKSDFW